MRPKNTPIENLLLSVLALAFLTALALIISLALRSVIRDESDCLMLYVPHEGVWKVIVPLEFGCPGFVQVCCNMLLGVIQSMDNCSGAVGLSLGCRASMELAGGQGRRVHRGNLVSMYQF